MSGITNQPKTTVVNPTALVGDLDQVKQQSQTSLNQALTNLGVLIASPNAGVSPTGAQTLQTPSAMNLNNVSDMSLRMGLLQEALNQLQQQVSKDQIQARLTQENQQGKQQIQQMDQQMSQIEAAYKKSQEASHKSNIFQAIGDWFKAAVDFVSAVFTAVAAVGEALENPVGAAGLFASTVAMIGACAIDTTLAINATVIAAGGTGFLSQSDINAMNIASTVLGAVAAVAGMLGGVGAAVMGLREVASIVAEQAVKEGVDAGVDSLAKTAVNLCKEALTEAFADVKTAVKEFMETDFKDFLKQLADKAGDTVKTALKDFKEDPLAAFRGTEDIGADGRQAALNAKLDEALSAPTDDAAKALYKEAMTMAMKNAMFNFTKLTERLVMTQGLGQGATQIEQGAGKLEVDNLQAQAAQLKQQGDQDAAKVKAIEAQIAKLEAMIQQLQDDLQKMMQGMMNSVSSILSAAEKSSESVGKLIQNSPA
jgi:cell division protein FtsB